MLHLAKLSLLALTVAACLLAGTAVWAEELVYVVNFRSDTLSIFRTDQDAVSDTIPILADASRTPIRQIPGTGDGKNAIVGMPVGGPVAIVVDPSRSLAYVAHTGSPGALSILNGAERRVVARITLDEEPFALALGRGGKSVLVANFDSDTVSVVDLDLRRVTATIPVGNGPSGIALSGDSALAYVSNFHSNTVSFVEVQTGAVAREVSVGKGPMGIALAGSLLLVVNSGSDTVSVIDTSTGTVTATIAVGKLPALATVNPDHSLAYVSNQGGGSISVIDTAAQQVTDTVDVGPMPFGLALNEGGDLIAVTFPGADKVSIVDTRSRKVLRQVPVGSSPFGVAIASSPGRGGCHCSIQTQSADPLWGAALPAGALLLMRKRLRTGARAAGNST